jgi:putative ABC transport system permease protein
MTAQFETMGVTTIMVSPSRGFSLTAHDVSKIESIPDVQSVIPYYSVAVTINYGGSSTSATIMALDMDSLKVLFPDVTVTDGKLPSQTEFTSAVIGFQLANPSDPEITPIKLNQIVTTSQSTSPSGGFGMLMGGQTSVATRAFLVVGMLDEFGQGLFINPDDTIFVPLTAGRLLTKSTDYSGLYVVAANADVVTSVSEAITNLYENDVRVMTVSSILSTVQSITGSMTTLLVSIAAISVAVAFMGIMTTMFTTINERTREIGVIKALGYSGGSVMLFFLTEAVLTGFIGGVVGSLVGATASYFVVSMFGGSGLMFGGSRGSPGASSAQTLAITPVITPELILAAILMATAVGALAGIIPAWRASRMTPVEALRHE